MAYYCSKNTNDYGSGIHQVVAIHPYTLKLTQQFLEEAYDFYVFKDNFPNTVSGYPNRLVIDTTGSNNVVRVKNDSEVLEDAKIPKYEEISRRFEEILLEGKDVSLSSGKNFKVDCAQKDINNWTSQLQLIQLVGMGDSEELTIGLYNNTEILITIAEFKEMCIDVGSYYSGLYQTKWQKRNQIKNATTMSQLESITW